MNVESVENLPLSPPMRALLALLVLAIDQRVALVQSSSSSATPGSSSSSAPSCGDEFMTCGACRGLGFVSRGTVTDEEDDSYDQFDDDLDPYSNVDAELADSIRQTAISNPTASASPTASDLVPANVMANLLARMNAPSVATPPSVTAEGQGDATGEGASLPPAQPAPVASGSQAPATQPVVTVAPPAVAPGSSQLLPGPPAGVNTNMPLPTTVPPETDIPPGFHSMNGHPAPAPLNAVYTGANAGPFYTVTRGLRVGVMAGWDTVSPYVVSVPGAVFRKQPTLLAAYIAYFQAYYRGSVKYT